MTDLNKSRISVIVITHPAYQKYLSQALESIPVSSRLEIVVWENKNDTLAAACNKAILKSTGDYIVRVDADDTIDERLIQIEADYLDNHPEIDCVWCDYWKKYEERLELCPQETLEHAGGAMFRREVWEKLGGYTPELEYQESFDFWLRFHKAGMKAARIEQPLYYYRQHPGSMSTNVEAREKVRQQILERHR
jgi:alpha-1,6-rhamnosyltransferase